MPREFRRERLSNCHQQHRSPGFVGDSACLLAYVGLMPRLLPQEDGEDRESEHDRGRVPERLPQVAVGVVEVLDELAEGPAVEEVSGVRDHGDAELAGEHVTVLERREEHRGLEQQPPRDSPEPVAPRAHDGVHDPERHAVGKVKEPTHRR